MKLTPEASMRRSASPGPGVGVGRSRRVRTSAEPVVRIWMACMEVGRFPVQMGWRDGIWRRRPGGGSDGQFVLTGRVRDPQGAGVWIFSSEQVVLGAME